MTIASVRIRHAALIVGIAAALIAAALLWLTHTYNFPYMVSGLTRAQLGYAQSGSGRYVYEGAVLWLVLLAGAARNLLWRGSWLLVVVAAGELPWPLSALPILIAVAVWLAVLIVPSPPPARREEVRPRPRSGRHRGGAPTSEAQPAQ